MRPRMLVRAGARVVPAVLVATSLYAAAVQTLHMPAGRLRLQVWAGVDFHTYLAAAVVALREGWASVYDQHTVMVEQGRLVPAQFAQPFLSPPPDALVVLPLTVLPYWLALVTWSVVLIAAMALALGWSTSYTGPRRVAAVAVALVPWWVLLAVYVGQVVPLVAAAVLFSWGFIRRDKDVVAGIVLSLIALKPNTAIVIPFALLAAGRWRVFVAWAAGSIVITGASLLVIAFDGAGDYLEALRQLPRGAEQLTLGGAYGLTGVAALAARIVIVAAALITARRLRATPGVAMAAGAIASLLIAPYLHNSDLCVLVAAAWMVWHEAPMFRLPLASMWCAASPFTGALKMGPTLEGWVTIEVALFVALAVLALARGRPGDRPAQPALTARGDLGEPAPA